ncbi:MAG: hypothetical protein V7L23_33280 [Nostoc sp.]|uniref:hypothetical protein n=1 Tax=Nostoc sp. TaxID=1180 RepID=UPI002FF0A2EF
MGKIKILKLLSVISFSFVPIIISSCSVLNNVVTKEEFDKIKQGMSYQEVIEGASHFLFSEQRLIH